MWLLHENRLWRLFFHFFLLCLTYTNLMTTIQWPKTKFTFKSLCTWIDISACRDLALLFLVFFFSLGFKKPVNDSFQMKIAAMVTLENREFYIVSKRLHKLETCLYHHTSLQACETSCVKQEKLAYTGKTSATLITMLITMLNPKFPCYLCSSIWKLSFTANRRIYW